MTTPIPNNSKDHIENTAFDSSLTVAYISCGGNVFLALSLAMVAFSGSAIPASSHHITV
jgi:hypothetical protein